MMKKQFILCLSVLLVVSCASSYENGERYSTLADLFVWGDDNSVKTLETPSGVKVSYKEKLPKKMSEKQDIEYNNYQYNDNVDVKYVDVVESNEDTVVAENVEDLDVVANNFEKDTKKVSVNNNDDIIIKEVIIETENPDNNTETYTLTKRSERYKGFDDKFSPNVYAIMASRVVNKFLTDIPAFFADKENPKLYIEEVVYGDRFLPSNPEVVALTTKEIVIGSKMIPVVEDVSDATHVLKGRLSNINTPEIPVFKYEIGLYDSSNKLIDKWSDTIRQVQNDDGSWW